VIATRAAATRPSSSSGRSRVVVVGARFAGFHCARALDRKFADQLEIVLVDPADHMLYLPLLPEVAGGVLDPRHAAIPLAASLRSTRVLTGTVTAIDPTEHTCRVRGADGREQELGWQRLVLNPGSVTRTFGIAGVDEHAHGFKTLAEALYLRKRILGQLELAAIAPNGSTREAHGSLWWWVAGSPGWRSRRMASGSHAPRCSSIPEWIQRQSGGRSGRRDRACSASSRSGWPQRRVRGCTSRCRCPRVSCRRGRDGRPCEARDRDTVPTQTAKVLNPVATLLLFSMVAGGIAAAASLVMLRHVPSARSE
jgi:hypothetical protein